MPHSIQSLAQLIYNEVMDTKDIRAVQMLGIKGITKILHDNKYGLDLWKDPDSLVPNRCWNPTLYHCIWNTLDATLALRDKLGRMHFNVLSKSFDFCRCLYGGEYSHLVVLIMFICQDCGHCPVFDLDWWVAKGAKTGGWYCAHCGARCCTDPMNGAVAIYLKGCPELSFVIPAGKL